LAAATLFSNPSREEMGTFAVGIMLPKKFSAGSISKAHAK
jgi:hypothetical protein